MATRNRGPAQKVRITREVAQAGRQRENGVGSYAASISAMNNAISSLHALPEGEIGYYGLDMFTSKEMIAYSVMEVTVKNGNSVGNHGSNTDPRLGAIRGGENCMTCNLPRLECSGHYSYITMNCHILNPIDEIYKRFLQTINMLCNSCFRPVVPSKDARTIMAANEPFSVRIEKLAARAEDASCGRTDEHGHKCGGKAYSFDDGDLKKPGWVGKIPLSHIQMVLEDLTDDDLLDMGFNRRPGPLGFIMSVLPVIPHRNRVAAATTYGTIDHHNLSKYYDKILRIAQSITPESELPIEDSSKRRGGGAAAASQKKAENERNDRISELSKAIEEMYKECYKKTLTDKDTGTIRNEHGGKTVPGSSRSVIVPAPELPVTHGKIPVAMAKISSIRETVTDDNYEFIVQMMNEGRIKTVFPAQSGTIGGIHVKKGVIYSLGIGDVVDREIVEGDVAIFNRPPTLQEAAVVPVTLVLDNGDTAYFNENTGTINRIDSSGKKGSIFSEGSNVPVQRDEYTDNIFVELLRYDESYVIGVPLPQTPAKAADYDGDEDAVVPSQSDDSRNEMKTTQNLMGYLLDGKDQAAAFAAVQDALLGAFEASTRSLPVDWRKNHKHRYEAEDLTSVVELIEKYAFVSKEYFADIVMMLDSPLVDRDVAYSERVGWTEDEDGELTFYGSFIESLEKAGVPFIVDGVIPANNLMSLVLPPNLTYQNHEVTIKNGIVIECRQISSKSIGNVRGGIVAHIAIQNSRKDAVNFITDVTWAFVSFHSFRSFSIGIGDCLPPTKEIQAQIDKATVRMYRDLEYLVEPSDDDRIAKRTYDKAYAAATGTATITVAKIVSETVGPENGLRAMIESGAKGNRQQLINMIGSGGQKYEDGKIPGRGLTYNTRRMVYFHADDTDPMAFGYVANSLANGVTRAELDSIQGNTRSDFIVMSQDTPTVGQASREICIVTIGTTVGPEGELRDSVGVISPTFAGDNFNPMRITRVPGQGGVRLSVIDLKALAAEINGRNTL